MKPTQSFYQKVQGAQNMRISFLELNAADPHREKHQSLHSSFFEKLSPSIRDIFIGSALFLIIESLYFPLLLIIPQKGMDTLFYFAIAVF